MSTGALPVIVALSREARPGHARELVKWAQDLCDDASQVPGYLGAKVRPVHDRDGLRVLVSVHFASAHELTAWELSPQRVTRLQEGDRLTSGTPTGLTLEQIDAAIAGAPHTLRVPKWRTALRVWLALYPLALLANIFLTPQLAGLPYPVGVAISSSSIVALVIWVTLPAVHAVWSWVGAPARRRARQPRI